MTCNCMGCPHRVNCRCRCPECAQEFVAKLPQAIYSWDKEIFEKKIEELELRLKVTQEQLDKFQGEVGYLTIELMKARARHA